VLLVNYYLIIIIAMLLGRYTIELVADLLNVRNLSDTLPPEFEGEYDAERYQRSQSYLKETTRFGLLVSTVGTTAVLAFVLLGGFNLVDGIARSANLSSIPTGLLFGGIVLLLSRLTNLPFSVYGTFVIEEKYGFNRTKPGTFVVDTLKTLVLTCLIGGPVFAAILWFFDVAGALAWVYCWVVVVVIEGFLLFLAPYVIMPLFNKFVPLEEGELKAAVEGYARTQQFEMKGVFKMDGSKRSAKSNAFFTGFGQSKRIVLYDTLIEKHSVPELVGIVAHEMGHYRRKHILKAIGRSVLTTGLTFFLMSLFIGNKLLFAAFGMDHVSIYASLVFFGFLYAPIAMLISLVEYAISRRHEYEADAFAVETCGAPDTMISALKRLSVDNLSNLTPHPLKVLLDYSHPPILDRMRAIAAASPPGGGRSARLH